MWRPKAGSSRNLSLPLPIGLPEDAEEEQRGSSPPPLSSPSPFFRVCATAVLMPNFRCDSNRFSWRAFRNRHLAILPHRICDERNSADADVSYFGLVFKYWKNRLESPIRNKNRRTFFFELSGNALIHFIPKTSSFFYSTFSILNIYRKSMANIN